MEDASTTREIGGDDSGGIGALLAEHRQDVVQYAFTIFGDWDCAEDVTHRSFMALLDKGRELDSSEAVRAFLFKAVRNRSLKVSRRRNTHRRLEDSARVSLYDPPASPEDVFADQQRRERLREALRSIAPRRRQALIMARVQGRSYCEVAEKMDISPQTVANHVSLALKDLREILGSPKHDPCR